MQKIRCESNEVENIEQDLLDDKIIHIRQIGFEQKMLKRLELLEEEEYLNNNIPVNNYKSKIKKF